ncbi:MAG: type III pantothenate kinase [Planctomycetota bacterium]
MTSPDCIAALDIGNTRMKLGCFVRSADGLVQALQIDACTIDSCSQLSVRLQEWWTAAASHRPGLMMVAGSDPDLRDELTAAWPLPDCPPQLVRSAADVPVVADVEQPHRVGIDRLLNACAARHWRRRIAPVIVIDSGTATTVDLVTSDGVFRGGSILPGLRLSAQALHEYTARLPLLDVDDTLAGWPQLPGRNTEAAMRAGLLLGQLGAVRELAAGLAESATRLHGESAAPELLVTGGGGRLLAEHLPDSVYLDSLALHALALLGQRS